MEKSKKDGGGDVEIRLPEPTIHHIQSFMSREEAAATTLISKSWHEAWSTRPSLDFDHRDFARDNARFFEFAEKTFQRYERLKLKIDSFTLRYHSCDGAADRKRVRFLIAKAMEIGATNLDLKFVYDVLPQEVLESATLVRLSLRHCGVDDGSYVIRCSNLKSLVLEDVEFTRHDMLKELIACCSVSIEELSLSKLYKLSLKGMDMFELQLHKLRRLVLRFTDVDSTFFADLDSKLPFLKDLSIAFHNASEGIQIASTSLETLSFEIRNGARNCTAQFDVPNIRKFTSATGLGLPDLSIKGGSREWELDISLRCNRVSKKSWFVKLRKLLTKFQLAKISLSIDLSCIRKEISGDEVDTKVVGKPLVLENLMICGESPHCCAFLVRMLRVFRPKFITHCWLTAKCLDHGSSSNAFLDFLCKKLMHQRITPNGGIPDENMFGTFGLESVNVEVYKMFGTDWQPLVLTEPLDASQTPVNKRKVRFQLIWKD